MNKLFIFSLFVLLSHFVFSQQQLICGLNDIRGGNVSFVFNSMNTIENGKTIGVVGIGYTEIYIRFDTVGESGLFYVPEVTGWELVAYALSADLESDQGSPNMNLNEIKLNCTMTRGNGTVVAQSFLTTDPNNVIASGIFGDGDPAGDSRVSPAGFIEWAVTISYDCGIDNPNGLKDYLSDIYRTDLFIYVRPIYA